jgi:hypothetical protein
LVTSGDVATMYAQLYVAMLHAEQLQNDLTVS